MLCSAGINQDRIMRYETGNGEERKAPMCALWKRLQFSIKINCVSVPRSFPPPLFASRLLCTPV